MFTSRRVKGTPVSAHRRSADLPVDGHERCPVVAAKHPASFTRDDGCFVLSTGKVAALSRATAFEASWAVISHSAYDAGQAHELLVCRSPAERCRSWTRRSWDRAATLRLWFALRDNGGGDRTVSLG